MSLPLDPASAGLEAALHADARGGQRAGRDRHLPDDGFWREVFGQAQAVAQGGGAAADAGAGQAAAGRRGHGPAAGMPIAAAASSAAVGAQGAAVAAAAFDAAGEAAAGAQARKAYGLPSVAARMPGAADAGEPAPTEAAARAARTAGPTPPRGPRPAEIAASVEIAADGERRIYLRGALDERRALELAARVAAIQGGAADAVSVRLNGRLLFKTAGHGDAARATTHTLPGRAYAGLADPARAAATDHTDQE